MVWSGRNPTNSPHFCSCYFLHICLAPLIGLNPEQSLLVEVYTPRPAQPSSIHGLLQSRPGPFSSFGLCGAGLRGRTHPLCPMTGKETNKEMVSSINKRDIDIDILLYSTKDQVRGLSQVGDEFDSLRLVFVPPTSDRWPQRQQFSGRQCIAHSTHLSHRAFF